MKETKRRKVMIVIEETGTDNGKGFNMYLAGDIERLGKTNVRDLTPAEFYGSQLFRICGQAIEKAGVVKSVKKNDVTAN